MRTGAYVKCDWLDCALRDVDFTIMMELRSSFTSRFCDIYSFEAPVGEGCKLTKTGKSEGFIMKLIKDSSISRRGALLGAAASGVFLGTGVATAQTTAPLASPPVRRNISSFSTSNWRDHFDNLNNGAILCDIDSRAVQYWSEDESVYKLYPSSVPESEELTKRGYTSVIKKVEGPSWRPTPSMKIRNPDWPDYFPPGPDNPLGTHALYLSWQYYRVHGTGDTRKIGRQSSNGCIGLYNEHIKELFALAEVGTQVKLF